MFRRSISTVSKSRLMSEVCGLEDMLCVLYDVKKEKEEKRRKEGLKIKKERKKRGLDTFPQENKKMPQLLIYFLLLFNALKQL